ncbi:HAD family phosphatase [Vibrio sp. SCSIO 43140]|uniref:Cof-type HAD-IIB family hydrolase n=1 Tax=Vibrio sp. SCSIO 43140 TaxID=2819100 RepID=UPI002074F23E|nr:Cof-type HAD-IIB family hydrolase [Vibrio sp. SCSIO 43140]USD61862.1 HAD family phosphatase [Vibrio sp. SCSIO 43140]
MYKLIAIDMDGTLLTSEKTISQRTKEAIAAAKAKGVTVVLASGRPLNGMKDALAELELMQQDDFVIHFNGTYVEKVASGERLHEQTLTGKDAKEVARLAQKLGLDCHAFSTEIGLITPRANTYTDHEAEINKLDINIYDFEKLEDDHQIIKAMIVGEPSKLTEQIANIDVDYHNRYTVVQSAPFFLEFLNPLSNKGEGVKVIADHLGIPYEQTMCFGDAENDHHMIKFAGKGVAMANAMEETKAIADYITDSNNEDGVAKAIEKFVL